MVTFSYVPYVHFAISFRHWLSFYILYFLLCRVYSFTYDNIIYCLVKYLIVNKDIELQLTYVQQSQKKNSSNFFLTFFIHTKLSPTQFIDICLLIFYITSMTILILTLIVIMVIIAIAIAIVNC